MPNTFLRDFKNKFAGGDPRFTIATRKHYFLQFTFPSIRNGLYTAYSQDDLGYLVQSIDLPNFQLRSEEGEGELTVKNLFGTYRITDNTTFLPDTNSFTIHFLDTEIPIFENFFFPWMRKIVDGKERNDSQYRGTLYVSVYDNQDNPKPRIQYTMDGVFPIMIDTPNLSYSPNVNLTRTVVFAFNEVKIESENVMTSAEIPLETKPNKVKKQEENIKQEPQVNPRVDFDQLEQNNMRAGSNVEQNKKPVQAFEATKLDQNKTEIPQPQPVNDRSVTWEQRETAALSPTTKAIASTPQSSSFEAGLDANKTDMNSPIETQTKTVTTESIKSESSANLKSESISQPVQAEIATKMDSPKVEYQNAPDASTTQTNVSYQETPETNMAGSKVEYQDAPTPATDGSRTEYQEAPTPATDGARVEYQNAPTPSTDNAKVEYQNTPDTSIKGSTVEYQNAPTSNIADAKVEYQDKPVTEHPSAKTVYQNTKDEGVPDQKVVYQNKPDYSTPDAKVVYQNTPPPKDKSNKVIIRPITRQEAGLIIKK